MTEEENKALKKWYEKEFKDDLEKPLSKTKEKYKKIEKSLEKSILKNTKINKAIIDKLLNIEIKEIITREHNKYVREISLCLFEQYPTFFEKIFINYRERKGKKYVEKDIEVYQ